MDKIVGGAAIEVGKCMVEPIKRQFNYLCCFNTNTQNLKDEAEKLDDAKVGVEGQVDAARRNNEVIMPRVETWLDDVNKIQVNMSGIEPEILNVKSGCLAIKSRFSLSRKATKMVEAMKELRDDHDKFGQISHPAPPAAMASIPLGHAYELESRRRVEEDIMTTLREKKVSMMGISGMGGVGKTTMAKKIRSRAREEGLFDEIVMAVVSQPVDMLRIQQEMAYFLGLRLEVGSLTTRAHQLCSRLMNSTKSILIILDDLWKALDLEELGIPDHRDLKECTILLTSRNTDVFSAMSVEKIFQIKILSEIEAWSLFKEKVGACADDQNLFPAAQEIVRECKGLPIALVNVGVALKDKKNKSIWENAVQELRSCNPQDIPEFLAQVYNPLKLSYDLLENEQAKLIFLFCCLFPEDREIYVFNLALYGWGLRIYEGTRSIQVACNKVQTLVEMLKSRSLLLDGFNEYSTKMHDVVRDVGIFIAGKKGLIDPTLSWTSWPIGESNHNIYCAWISLFGAQKIMFPEGSMLPNLRFLLLERNVATEELPLHENIFESTEKLNVLSIGYFGIMKSLPNTIQLLKGLRTLILYGCSSLEDFSAVGELISLEVLYCHGCHSIEELPVEIGKLNQLKLLNISDCKSLKTVAAGVISRLVRLEELTLIGSFRKWESGASGGKNAALCELKSLSSLTTLRIQIEDAFLAAEQFRLPNLLEFNISIGYQTSLEFNISIGYQTTLTEYGKQMWVELEGDFIIGDWILQLLRITKSLHLRGEGSSKLLSLVPFQSLKHLWLENAKTTTLVNGRSSGPTNIVFPLLESLWLEGIDDLEEIPISSDSFKNLQELRLYSLPNLQHLWNVFPHCYNISSINIQNCCSLRSLFTLEMGKYHLLQLKSLTISRCLMLEQVMMWDEEENGQRSCRRIEFPKLENLILDDLPRLTTLCKGIDSTEFPSLNIMRISICPNLKRLVCKLDQAEYGRLKHLMINGYDSISILWSEQLRFDIFTTLVGLSVSNCGNIKSSFSRSLATNLVNLKNLAIKNCAEMVKVIEDDEVERSPFIKLEELSLRQLPKLEAFCDWRCALLLPSLRRVYISECPLMERFPFGILSSQIYSNYFKNLESIEIGFCSMLEQAVLWNEEENGKDHINGQSIRITFPKLKKLHLHNLPRFTSLCKGIQSIEFPRLSEMYVKCPNLKSLLSSTEDDHKKCSGAIHDADDALMHLFCKSQAAFGRLEDLHINGYENISSLWCDQIPMDFYTRLVDLTVQNCGNIEIFVSPSISGNLVNLTTLTIKSCREMVKVIEGQEAGRSPFMKLEVLKLTELPKLKAFCDWRCDFRLPSLKKVHISKCPEMERFSFGSLTTPKLNYFRKNSAEIRGHAIDLNDDALFGGDLNDDELFVGDSLFHS